MKLPELQWKWHFWQKGYSMGKRRRSREAILKILYKMDLSKDKVEDAVIKYWQHLDLSEEDQDSLNQEEVQAFAKEEIEGVVRNIGEIDRIIELHSTNWKVSRMTTVDRNILRMAVFELLYCPDIPVSVTINEAIEIGKKFGSEDSASFINGILDDIAKGINKTV